MGSTDDQVNTSLKEALLTETLIRICEENGATDITRFSLSAEARIADEIVIVTVGSNRVLGSLTEELRRYLKKAHRLPWHGVPRHDPSGWVVIDFGDVIVHLMNSEQRAYYHLDDLYAKIRATEQSD